MFHQKIDKDLSLVLLQPIHAAELYALVYENKAYLSRWLLWPEKIKSEQDYVVFIKSTLMGLADSRSWVCGIEYRGRLAGVVGFNEINHHLKKAILGYWLAENLQGKGIINRSCLYLFDYAFKVLQLEKIEAHVATHNSASNGVCQRMGFQLEGTISFAEKLQGEFVDHHIYGLKRS